MKLLVTFLEDDYKPDVLSDDCASSDDDVSSGVPESDDNASASEPESPVKKVDFSCHAVTSNCVAFAVMQRVVTHAGIGVCLCMCAFGLLERCKAETTCS